jgi:hypothetical protein
VPSEETGRGVSAWVYENRSTWTDAMNAYNLAVPSDQGLDSLFPYVGGVSFGGAAYGTEAIWFDEDVVAYHAAALPGARMLPIFDSGDGEIFALWSDADQRLFAADVADLMMGIAGVAGAHVDIEPFRVAHLPFYDELGERLRAQGKVLTVFTGASAGDIYGLADVVVLSGYDLGIDPVTPTEYGQVLGNLVGAALHSAQNAGVGLLVGVPIAASWEQYENQSGTCDHDTGFSQEEWFQAALGAVCPHREHPHYLGLSLWGFYGDALEIPRGSGCYRHPGGVSQANWDTLIAWAKDGCDSP